MKLVLTSKIRTLFQSKTEVFYAENTNIFILWVFFILQPRYISNLRNLSLQKSMLFDGYCIHLKCLPSSRWQITPLGGNCDDIP